MKNLKMIAASLAILPVFCVSPLASAAPSTTQTLLVYPGTGKANISIKAFHTGYQPLVAQVADTLLLKPKLVRTIAKYTENRHKKNAPEFVFGPPQAAAVFMDAGYIPLVRLEKKAAGLLVSAKELTQVSRIGYPDPESWLAIVGKYSANQLIKQQLQHNYYKTQDEVVAALRVGEIEVGALRNNTFEKLQKNDTHFKAIVKLPHTADFTFLAHASKTTQEQRDYIKKTLLQMTPAVQEGLAAVTHVKVDKFVEAATEDYDVLRQIIKLEEQAN